MPMPWLILALECLLLVILWHRGTPFLFPGFSAYLLLATLCQTIWCAHGYQMFLFSQVIVIPAKLFVAWEAFANRAWWLRRIQPANVRGEAFYLAMGAFWLGMGLTIAAGAALEIQYNVDQLLGRIRVMSQCFVSLFLLATWLYFALRPLPRGRIFPRSTAHLAILTFWFVVNTAVNLVPIGPKDYALWSRLYLGANLAQIGCLASWAVLFFRKLKPRSALSPLLSSQVL